MAPEERGKPPTGQFTLPLRTKQGAQGQKIVLRGVDGVLRAYDSLDDVPEEARAGIQQFLAQRAKADAQPAHTPTPGLDVPQESLAIEHRWLKTTTAFADAFVLIMLGIAVYLALSGKLRRTDEFVILWIVAPLAPIFLFRLLAGILNRTVLTVQDGLLKVRHGPIPWRGCTLRLDHIVQIFVRVAHGQRGRVHISLHAVVQDESGSHHRTLIGNLRSEADALRLERQLETALNIEDWPDYNTRAWI